MGYDWLAGHSYFPKTEEEKGQERRVEESKRREKDKNDLIFSGHDDDCHKEDRWWENDS